MRLLVVLFVVLSVLQSQSAAANETSGCQLNVACPLGERSYHARLPDGWDGKSTLPVLLHFHGWGRQGPLIMKHGRIAGATKKLGVLLLAPNGRGRSWDFWNEDTDDVDFARSVIEDAAKRWPIDRAQIFVSGYSYGSAMAWRFACAQGSIINTLLAVSGSIPDQTETCADSVNIRHVHGVKDTVMDYPFDESGKVESAVNLWRRQNKCAKKADQKTKWQAVKILPFERYSWNKCRTGKSIVLDVHQRGHFIPRFWIETQLRQILN